MDYEKAYNDAMARLELVVRTGMKLDPAYIFPELAESEDERIRKKLYNTVMGTPNDSTWFDGTSKEAMLAWLEKQKEQKPILKVFGFKVGDAVRLKDGDGRKHIIKSFEEVEGIHGPNFYHVEFEDNSARDGIYPGEEYPNGYYTQMEKFEEEQKPAEGREYSCADCGTTSGYTNDESEGDKRYREGIRYALQQTEDYTIGKTFKGLIPCWVNAPSKLHPAHKYHGKNVVIMHENNGGFRCVCIDDEKPVTFHLSEDTLFAEGWRKPADRFEEAREKYQVEWSEEDEKSYKELIHHFESLSGCLATEERHAENRRWLSFLKSLRPSWKPSEEQMEALKKVVAYFGDSWVSREQKALDSLYNDLDKLSNEGC